MVTQKKTKQTTQNVRLPFIGSMTNREASPLKDQRFINIFPETRKVEAIESTKIFLNKRPGLQLYKNYGTGEGRGISFFNNKLYIAVGDKVWEDALTPVLKITLSNSTGNVGMVVGNSSNTGDYLFLCDGNKGWTINTAGTVTEITDTTISGIVVDVPGDNYANPPIISFTGGGGGIGAAAEATISSGSVTSIIVTNNGSGYTLDPTVVITPLTKTFNGNTAVNLTDNTIFLPIHNYPTGQALQYTAGTTPIGGLVSGTTYFVIAVDNNFFKLALNTSDASSGTAIDFTSLGSNNLHSTKEVVIPASASALRNAFPSTHTPTPVFIDGYILLSKGSDVYNCALDDPNIWDPSNYLSAEMYPDPVDALARQNNLVVVFGKYSIEFFYDAANAVASPLARNDSTAIQIGCASPHAIYQQERLVLFVGQSETGGRAVWQIDGTTPKRVSDEYIDRILDSEPDALNIEGFGIRTMGHLFFVLNLYGAKRTLVYDTEEKLWHEWSTTTEGPTQYLTNPIHSTFRCNHMVDTQQGYSYLLDSTNGNLYKFLPSVYNDNTVPILSEITTNKFDMDTYKRKFMSNFRLVGDRYLNNKAYLRWSDDDYQTWSAYKEVNLSDDFPNQARMGSFRRRAFQIRHIEDQPLRLESFEITYQEGDS